MLMYNDTTEMYNNKVLFPFIHVNFNYSDNELHEFVLVK